MNWLALDTALGVKIILSVNGEIYKFYDEEYKMASSVLLPKIDDLLKKAGVKISDIDVFATTIGPGSFTGIRIAVNTARAFAYALKKPVLPIDCLTVGAYSCDKACSSVLYGWSDNYYVASFDEKHQMQGEARAIKEDELNALCGVVVADDKTAEIVKDARVYDGVDALIRAVRDKIEKNEMRHYSEVEPFYVMPSQAERDRANKDNGI